MRLLIGLVARVIGIVMLCLAFAAGWVMVDANRTIQNDVAASADRVRNEAVRLAWREMTFRSAGPASQTAFPDWRSSDALRVISPGYCVSLAWGDEKPRRLCAGLSDAQGTAPEWFASLNRALFGPVLPVTRTIALYLQTAGVVQAEADQGAVALQTWRQVSVVVGVAAAMAAAISLLVSVVIGHALLPAERIVQVLRRLEQGDHTARVPAFRSKTFAYLARAVNDLTERLALTTAQRAALTYRLLDVQEAERRALARDLHDEFGQCLTAAGAIAAAVAARSEAERPDVAQDVGQIASVVDRMKQSLREALGRLRPPDFEEAGLRRSLERLVAASNKHLAAANAAGAPPKVFVLDVEGDLDGVPEREALGIYRVVQECLTNAARHGRPRRVTVAVVARAAPDFAVSVTVEDDGGGDPKTFSSGSGLGLLGIRERVAAFGGSLSLDAAERGVRVAALIPIASWANPGVRAGGLP